VTDDPRSPLSSEARALDVVVREAREDLVPPDGSIDWEALEARVLERATHEPAPAAHARSNDQGQHGRAMRFGALALAAAAAIAVVVRNDHDAPLLDASTVDREAGVASALHATEGAGDVRIGGLSAAAGQILHAGDVLEADGARAVLERPRKVTWLLEKDSGVARARVRSAGESLVLALEDGAVEAQVTPVLSGEAFAVDVASGAHLVRVAVHGTHLRVARAGTHVVVDLSEGVVSIGVPPRTGSTFGTLVTAPAHVEFDAGDLDHTLRVDHAPGSVRAPVPLVSHEPVAVLPREAPVDKGTARPTAPLQPSAVALRSQAPAAPERPQAIAPAPEPPKAPLPAREAIVAAVRDCVTSKGRPGEVSVTVTSTLRLTVGPGGVVESALFVPPLQPEVQSCAAAAIYKVKLDQPGTTTIPIELSY
jgi:hypothetical protein